MNEMPNEEQWGVMESVDDALGSARILCGVLQSLLKSTETFVFRTETDILKTIRRREFDRIDAQGWYRLKDAFGAEVLGRVEEMYRVIENSSLIKIEAEPTAPYEQNRLDLLVSAAVTEGMLVVKTPHLLNRNATYHHGKGHAFWVDYHSFFAPEVERVVDCLRDEIPLYPYKNICVLSSYREEKTMLPDAENLDSKRIIDAILHRYPGADGGKYCSVFQACFYDKELPEGAYFIVSEGFARVPDLQSLLSLLRGLTFMHPLESPTLL